MTDQPGVGPVLGERRPRPPITFGTTVGASLRRSFVAAGRASRSEFWLFVLCYLVLTAGTMGLGNQVNSDWLVIVGVVMCYVLLVPFVTAGIRRMHDTGRRGAWLLLLPTFLFFVTLIFWTEPRQPHANRFGP